MKIIACRCLFLAGIAVLAQFPADADDAYFDLPVTSLNLTEGSLPAPGTIPGLRKWRMLPAMQPYAELDGAGEVYVTGQTRMPWYQSNPASLSMRVCIRTPNATDVTGRIFMPQTNFDGMVQVRFKVAAADAKSEARQAFFRAKEEHYRDLQQRNIPGAAWFRHQAEDARKNLSGSTNAETVSTTTFQTSRESELEDTYDLFTGGRALSENLQFDRVLPAAATSDETVPITNLTGITVREMNWKELIGDSKPALDPLAQFIPGDQHAVFFPSFQAMVQMIDEADANGTPVLEILEPRSEDATSRTRYEKQLCLGLTEVSRHLGPQVVASVAFTGSDPFLRVGTDLAVLFEARNPDLLKMFLAAQQQAAQVANASAKSVRGDIDGVMYTGLVSPDRFISCYMASISNVIMISNSRVQLESLIRVAREKGSALSSQDEYLYFRSRYPRTDSNETAFVVLTDATIRRWCGPRWRIADSRRTRVAAVMSELQAAHLNELASAKADGSVLPSAFKEPGAGEFRLMPSGVISSTYGSLRFMTPISEIPLQRVTRIEADTYRRWADSYQRNWRQYFDPIAIRFSLSQRHLGAEMTVMPLIAASDYRRFIEFGTGSEIASGSGDPHTNALLHLVFAINTQSPSIQDAGNFVGSIAPGLKANPFGWIGKSLAIYADDDPFWDRLKASTNSESFLEHNYPDLPLALHFDVKNPLGLAAFLTAVHAFVDQSAPKITTWQNLEYKDQPYVKITSHPAEGQDAKELAIYYAATPRALTITLSEVLLKRALDRQASGTNGPSGEINPAWLGKSMAALARQKFFAVLQLIFQDSYESRLQLLAWNNLPILNEWKRLYPGKDPVQVHERLWGTKLLCPGGGKYVWNQTWGTMESTVFGHPGKPKSGANNPLAAISSVQLGVTFENQGLSAKAMLNRNVAR